MKIGKVPNEVLQKLVLDRIKYNRSEVVLRPKIGEDCTAVDFGDYICVLSTDPITGAVNEVGRLAVHISCNDVASCGVEPIGLMLTILMPQEATESDLGEIMKQICTTAASLNVDIIGGHTEVTAAVNRFVITSTALGRAVKGKLVTTSGAKPGDSIIITKTAGIEGTAIIAHDKEEELLKLLDADTVKRAKNFIENISVVKEGIIAGNFGASAMHDVTEGGVLGAIWELTEASGVGAIVFRDKIPVEKETLKISEVYGIDPLKLISSGCMLITCQNGEGLVNELRKNGIKSSIIGTITSDGNKFIEYENKREEIEPPQADELYKAI